MDSSWLDVANVNEEWRIAAFIFDMSMQNRKPRNRKLFYYRKLGWTDKKQAGLLGNAVPLTEIIFTLIFPSLLDELWVLNFVRPLVKRNRVHEVKKEEEKSSHYSRGVEETWWWSDRMPFEVAKANLCTHMKAILKRSFKGARRAKIWSDVTALPPNKFSR